MQQRFLRHTAAIAALGMTMALSGCGSSGGSGDVTLKVVAADYGNSAANSSEKYWNSLAKEFESKNPGIKVDVDVRSWKTVDADVAKMVRDGEAPDIAQIGAYADYVKKESSTARTSCSPSPPRRTSSPASPTPEGRPDPVRNAVRRQHTAALLQQGPLRGGRPPRAAGLGRHQSDAEALKAQDVRPRSPFRSAPRRRRRRP